MAQRELQALAGDVVAGLRKRGWTLGLAESCTGGLVSHLVTQIAGSSEAFLLGAVTYSNAMKEEVLGVSGDSLNQYGAVSENVAREMAEGVRRISGSTLSCATSGIAGPGGGTAEKPVGMVCFGFSRGEECITRTVRFDGTRYEIKEQSAHFVLDWIRRQCERE